LELVSATCAACGLVLSFNREIVAEQTGWARGVYRSGLPYSCPICSNVITVPVESRKSPDTEQNEGPPIAGV
jgi:hypothetical protein